MAYMARFALVESNLECQGPSGGAKRSPPGEGKCPVTLSLSRLAPSASAWAARRPVATLPRYLRLLRYAESSPLVT